jgi:5'-nucleotidase
MLYINNDKLKNTNFTASNFYVVIDFDRTLTSNKSLGSWAVLENPELFSKDFVNDSHKLMEKYYPYEIDYTLDFKTKEKYIAKWYYENMDLFYKYGLTQEILLNCIKHSKLEFRKGAKDFLEFLYKNNVPVVILSAGIGNIIEEFLKMNNCYFDNIYIISNFIKFENNLMLKFTDNMIHSLNKKIQNLPTNFEKELSKKDYILLVGDLIEDISMVSKDDLPKTLTIGFLENKIKENLDFYNKNFDIVFTENSSFDDIKNLIFNF